MPATDQQRKDGADALYKLALRKIRAKAPGMFEPQIERFLNSDHADVVEAANAVLDAAIK